MARNSIFLNRVSTKLIFLSKDETFYNLRIPYEKSKDGFLTVTMRLGQVIDSTKKADKSVIEGYKNIVLGSPDTVRQCSICTKLPTAKREGKYDKIELTNAQLVELFKQNRAAYKAAQKAKQAEAETAPATAEAADEPINA